MGENGKESEAVEQAALRYFHALTEPETETSRFSTGALAELNRLIHATTFGSVTSEVTIERIEVGRIEGESAEADIDARQRLAVESAYGTQRVSAHFTGPLRLHRVDGEWRVADYVMDGDSLVESFFPLEVPANGAAGVVIRPQALFRNRNTVVFYLEIENQGPHTVELSWACFKCCFAQLSRAEVAPGETVFVRTGWRKRLAPWNRRLKIVLHARPRSAPDRHTFETTVHLNSGRAPVRRLRRVPFSLWLNRLAARAAVRVPLFASGLVLAAAFHNYHGVVAFGGFLGAALLSDEIVAKLDKKWWQPALLLRIGFDLLGIAAIIAAVLFR